MGSQCWAGMHPIEGHSHHTARMAVSVSSHCTAMAALPHPGLPRVSSILCVGPSGRFLGMNHPRVGTGWASFHSAGFQLPPRCRCVRALYGGVDSLAGVRPHFVLPVVSGRVLGIASSAVQDICEQVFVETCEKSRVHLGFSESKTL